MKALILLLLTTTLCLGQDVNRRTQWPLTVTIFSESIGLPNFRNVFKNGNLGVRIGTELFYRQGRTSQWLQTFQVGYYTHREWHQGFFVKSEVGYRRFFNHTFADVTFGAGYLLAKSELPRYSSIGQDFKKMNATFGRLMPTLGIGAGYQFKSFSLFSRYEVFGEMPFGYGGLPVLPHKTIHVGTRFNVN
ncbi:MAG: hypothetical protein ACOYW3_16130 [Bacteroidota bacterium]